MVILISWYIEHVVEHLVSVFRAQYFVLTNFFNYHHIASSQDSYLLLVQNNVISYCRINYLDFPWQSKNWVPESAFCAMIDENVYPKVR